MILRWIKILTCLLPIAATLPVEKIQSQVGHSVTLSCPIERQRPEWWRMNNFAIVEADLDGPITGKSNVAIQSKKLIISNISFADEGTYSCSDNASPMASFTITVFAIPLPPVIWAITSQSGDHKMRKVTCESRYGRPVAGIKFWVDGEQVEPKNAEIRQEANNTLTISSSIEVEVTDKVVTVTCSSEHSHSIQLNEELNKASIQLRTYTLPKPVVTPEKLDHLREGQTVVVDCRIPDSSDGVRPSLIWKLPDGYERQQVFIERGFIINRMSLIVGREMNGQALSCRSELSLSASVPVELEMSVLYAPLKPNLAVIMPAGKSEIGIDDLSKVKLNCDNVDSNPMASVRILVNGFEIGAQVPKQPNKLLKLLHDGRVTKHVSDLIRASGRRTSITCVAHNSVGSSASEAQVLPVLAPPSLVRLGSLDKSHELSRDMVSNTYSFRAGARAGFFCDLNGGELSLGAKVIWRRTCPMLDSNEAEAEREEKLIAETAIEISETNQQHARSALNYSITDNDDGCHVSCQAVDPVAGTSPFSIQNATIQVFYGPEEVEVRFAQAAAYNDGEKVQAICELGPSKPKPSVTWSIISPNGMVTTTSLPDGEPALTCESRGLSSQCNASIEFKAQPELTGSIVRCTATNSMLSVVVANDRRLEVLFKPKTSNPSRCFSRFVVDFNGRHNLSEHCSFEANPPIDAKRTRVFLVSAMNAKSPKKSLDPPRGYSRNQNWEMVRFPRQLHTLEDLDYLDSYLVIHLANAVGESDFKIPVRINHNVVNVQFENPVTKSKEIWEGDSVEVSCSVSSMYQVARFAFETSKIRQGDIIQSVSGDLRTIKMTIPHIKLDADIAGEARLVGCIAEFPASAPVKNITEIKEIAISRPIQSVAIFEQRRGKIRCRPTVGGGGELKYRWWSNGNLLNSGRLSALDEIRAAPRTKYECEIVQRRANSVISTVKSSVFVVGQTPLHAIFYELNVTTIRIFSNSAEFTVAKAPSADTVLPADAFLPPAEVRISFQRDGGEQEYMLTKWIVEDELTFNISELQAGSTYKINFLTLFQHCSPCRPESNIYHSESKRWKTAASILVTTSGSPIAVLRLRPEETAIIIILASVSAALLLLFCNIFICVKIRRKRRLMKAAEDRRRTSACCFTSPKAGTKQIVDTTSSPAGSDIDSGPTSVVDMLTPNAQSCSTSSTSSDTTSGRKSETSHRRKDIVDALHGFFASKAKNSTTRQQNSRNEAPSNSIYRDLFGNDSTNMSPVLNFLDAPSQVQHQTIFYEDGSLYRTQPSAVYSIPIQFHHVGASNNYVAPTPTSVPPAMAISSSNTVRTSSSELPLELQGDLV